MLKAQKALTLFSGEGFFCMPGQMVPDGIRGVLKIVTDHADSKHPICMGLPNTQPMMMSSNARFGTWCMSSGSRQYLMSPEGATVSITTFSLGLPRARTRSIS